MPAMNCICGHTHDPTQYHPEHGRSIVVVECTCDEHGPLEEN